MTRQIETGCEGAKQHRAHLCSLMERGKTEEIKQRTDQPKFSCRNCRAVANKAEDLCKPEPF
ncbi:MAG: hypothetical protein C0616_12280 [Desulfuromonas sp.]|nr:MAG: hypothetical protein C0616_12280 [Desulfuromonas sp.]